MPSRLKGKIVPSNVPIYKLPDLDGFEPRQHDQGYLLVADEAILFSTSLLGSEAIRWLERTLNAERRDGYLWVDGKPFSYFSQEFNFKRTLRLQDCCPLLGLSYLESEKIKGALYFTLRDDLEREWRATITLGALVSGNWMVEALRSIFPVLLTGELLPEPISFDAGLRVITTDYGDLSISLPAHWDVKVAGDVIEFYIPDVQGGKLLVGGLGSGVIMDYRGRPEDFGWEGEEGEKLEDGEVTFWKALKRVNAKGVEKNVIAVMRVKVFRPGLMDKLRNLCELIWKSAYFSERWPYVSLGYLAASIPSLKPSRPSGSVKPPSSPPKAVKRVKPARRPRVDLSKPSPFMSTIGRVLASPWKSAQGGKPKVGGFSSGSTWGRRGDVSDYNWANSSTFYVDQDGSVRSSEYNDELVADEIGDDGTLYKDGRAVGRVSEGYVYDTQGNVVGTLDTSISDRWQLESYEQRVNPDTFGTGWSLDEDEVRETDSPFVSSYGRDEDDQED